MSRQGCSASPGVPLVSGQVRLPLIINSYNKQRVQRNKKIKNVPRSVTVDWKIFLLDFLKVIQH